MDTTSIALKAGQTGIATMQIMDNPEIKTVVFQLILLIITWGWDKLTKKKNG